MEIKSMRPGLIYMAYEVIHRENTSPNVGDSFSCLQSQEPRSVSPKTDVSSSQISADDEEVQQSSECDLEEGVGEIICAPHSPRGKHNDDDNDEENQVDRNPLVGSPLCDPDPPLMNDLPRPADCENLSSPPSPEDVASIATRDVTNGKDEVLKNEYSSGIPENCVLEDRDTHGMSGIVESIPDDESQCVPAPRADTNPAKHKRKQKKKKQHHHHDGEHRKKHQKKKKKKDKKVRHGDTDKLNNSGVKPLTLSAVIKGTIIVSVQCEEFDMRNKIKLRRTAQGWVSTPVNENSDKSPRTTSNDTPVLPSDVTSDDSSPSSEKGKSFSSDEVECGTVEEISGQEAGEEALVPNQQTDVASQTSDDALDNLQPLPEDELYMTCNDQDEGDLPSDSEHQVKGSPSEHTPNSPKKYSYEYESVKNSPEHPLDLTQSSLNNKYDSDLCKSDLDQRTEMKLPEHNCDSPVPPTSLPPVKERKRAHLDDIVTKIKKARTLSPEEPFPIDWPHPIKTKSLNQIQLFDCKQWEGLKLQISPVGCSSSPLISPTTSLSPGGLTPSENELITAVRNAHLELPAYLLIPGYQLVSLFGNPLAELPRLIMEQLNHVRLVRKNPRALVDSSFIYLPTSELVRLLSDDPNNKHLPRLLATSSSVNYSKLEPNEKFRDIHLWQSKEFGVDGQVARVSSGGFYRNTQLEKVESVSTSWKKWDCMDESLMTHIPKLIPIGGDMQRKTDSVSPKIRVKPDLQSYPVPTYPEEDSMLAQYLLSPGSLMGLATPTRTISPGLEPNFPILQSFLNCPPPVGYPSYPELTRYLESNGASQISWHRPTPYWTPNHSASGESGK